MVYRVDPEHVVYEGLMSRNIQAMKGVLSGR